DTEDYSTFYGRQLEKYYRKHFGDADATFVTEQLKYTKEQLGKDWENDIWVSYNPLKINHVSIYNDKIDRLFSYGEPVPYVKKVYKKKWLLRDFSVGRAENDALQISTLENYLKDARRKKDDVVMFRLNLSDKALARVEKRLEKVTKGFYKFDCPSGEAGCQRKGEYYLMVKTDFLPNKFQQYSLLRNNCAVFVKRMLFNDVIGSGMNFSLGTVGNLPSNVADWAYNRTSTILDRNRKVTRSNKIIYYDYNNTGKK
ncbi:hypothetical protein, partial [Pseudoleptotrichia goodfellowii]